MGVDGMIEKNSDGKMGLVVERVYIYICMWLIFLILGLFLKVLNCFLSFFVMLYIWILIVNLKEY